VNASWSGGITKEQAADQDTVASMLPQTLPENVYEVQIGPNQRDQIMVYIWMKSSGRPYDRNLVAEATVCQARSLRKHQPRCSVM